MWRPFRSSSAPSWSGLPVAPARPADGRRGETLGTVSWHNWPGSLALGVAAGLLFLPALRWICVLNDRAAMGVALILVYADGAELGAAAALSGDARHSGRRPGRSPALVSLSRQHSRCRDRLDPHGLRAGGSDRSLRHGDRAGRRCGPCSRRSRSGCWPSRRSGSTVPCDGAAAVLVLLAAERPLTAGVIDAIQLQLHAPIVEVVQNRSGDHHRRPRRIRLRQRCL